MTILLARVLCILAVAVSLRVIIFMRYTRDDLSVCSKPERFAAVRTRERTFTSLPLILIDFSRLLADLALRSVRRKSVLCQDSLAPRMFACESTIQLFGAPLKKTAAARRRTPSGSN